MENLDDVLEEGREELTLDRPLTVGNSTTAVVELSSADTPKPLYLHHQEPQNGFQDASTISYVIYDGEKDNKEIFHPLSSSEKCCLEKEELVDDGIVNKKNPETIALPPSSLISTNPLFKNEKMPNSKKTEKKLTRYPYPSKQPLVSCLKSNEKYINSENKKIVHFLHSGPGECVTEYIDPVDPWRDVRTPSKGEVISFYRNACQKLRSKPIDKVIKQIQERSDLSTRSETLVLRGVRLDVRACEALESVFRRIQFENLDLENCSLEEDGATAILEMVEFYQSTCKLNIACNPKIGMRGWQSLCRMLRKTHVLTYLDARRTLLTDMTMPTFGRCLKADPNLKILHLEGVFLSGRPLLILTTAMKSNRVLEELYLGDNNLTSSDGPPIGAMLTYNTTLQLLDLRNNQMKDVGLAHVGNGLADQSEQESGGLCSLIMWNNGLTHEGMGYLCEGLVRTTSLKALNLGQNRIGDLGLQKLKSGLIKNKSLRKLGFLNTKLGNEGAVALAEVLADSLTITRIDIRENNVLTAGLMAFSMALKVNTSLLRLDLDKEMKKEPGMESVMQGVLVDVYNLCYRNKQLARKNLSSSSSSISSEPTLSHTSSFEMSDAISVDDVFHPESLRQEITPFSPAENLKEITFPDRFTDNKKEPIQVKPATVQRDIDIENGLAPERRLRSHSEPVVKKSVESKPARASRFSVTKIIDTLTSGVAHKIASNVANIDHKFKRQLSKEKTDCSNASELMPVLEQDGRVVRLTTNTESVGEHVTNDKEILQNSHNSDDITVEESGDEFSFTRTWSAPERISSTREITDENLVCTTDTSCSRCELPSECLTTENPPNNSSSHHLSVDNLPETTNHDFNSSVENPPDTSDCELSVENLAVTSNHDLPVENPHDTSNHNSSLGNPPDTSNHNSSVENSPDISNHDLSVENLSATLEMTNTLHSTSTDLSTSIDNGRTPPVSSSFSSTSFSLINDDVSEPTTFDSSAEVLLNAVNEGSSFDSNADSFCNSIVATQSLVMHPTSW